MDQETTQKMITVCEGLIKMLQKAFQGFRQMTESPIREAEEFRRSLQVSSSALIKHFIDAQSPMGTGKEWVKPYLFIASCFDRMGYNIEGILDRLKRMIRGQILFTDRAIKEIDDIFLETIGLLENLPDLFLTRNKLLAQQVAAKGKSVFTLADAYAEEHEKRLIEGICVPQSSPVYLDILTSLKDIVGLVREIAEKVETLTARV